MITCSQKEHTVLKSERDNIAKLLL